MSQRCALAAILTIWACIVGASRNRSVDVVGRWKLMSDVSNGHQLDKPHAAPWLAATEWPWESIASHDLPSLLSVVHQFSKPFGGSPTQKRVSAVLTTSSLQALLLNWVFSLVMYGNSNAYIIVVLDSDSLAHCQSLRLPCWDARPALADTVDLSSISGNHAYNHTTQGSGYNKLVHAKPAIVLELLKHNFDVHFSDVDVVFVRDVWCGF